jgi:hypothetical protein
MSSKIKQNAALMMAMMATAMSEGQNSRMFTGRGDDDWVISPQPTYKFNFSIPNGTKLYLFESNGNFETFTEFASRNEMPNYCVFHTIALNDKSALKKFTKFKNTQNV